MKKSLAYLVKTGHIWLIPQLVIQSGSQICGLFPGQKILETSTQAGNGMHHESVVLEAEINSGIRTVPSRHFTIVVTF